MPDKIIRISIHFHLVIKEYEKYHFRLCFPDSLLIPFSIFCLSSTQANYKTEENKRILP